jgi:hypothetical protein
MWALVPFSVSRYQVLQVLTLCKSWGKKDMEQSMSCSFPSSQCLMYIAFAALCMDTGANTATKCGCWIPRHQDVLSALFPYCLFSCGHDLEKTYIFLSLCFPPKTELSLRRWQLLCLPNGFVAVAPSFPPHKKPATPVISQKSSKDRSV